ncbi:MAG: hypothetical protein KDB03_20700 [Planctomycetales bacterium]|nr:hypothetical protein [Planctomycetales bacterium]
MTSDYFNRLADEWRQRAPELAAWTMRTLVNRTDVWGRYLAKKYRENSAGPPNHAVTVPFRDERGKVFLDEKSLTKHFRTTAVSGVLGIHSASTDLTSRWLAVDIDLHDDQQLSVTAEGNFVAAKYWFEKLVNLGCDPLLLDSNGRGGFHILLVFQQPMCTYSVFEFGLKLVSDYQQRGLDQSPEVFPGKPHWHRYGDWLRLPGRHHTHDHYSRVYSQEDWHEGTWLQGHDAIDRLLATHPTNLDVCTRLGIRTRRRTICLDFDGVIHSYRSGWQGHEIIPDPPIHGCEIAISKLREHYRVVVHSARCATQEGREAIARWLKQHRIEVDEICEHKPPAFVYLDDRAITFRGNWIEAISEISDFRK